MASNFLVFEYYNVRLSCLQLSVARMDPTPKYNKSSTVVFLTMAPSMNKSVSMDAVKKGGMQLFDYANKIVMKLERHEIAAIAKLKNPYYIRQYTQQAFDASGRPKQDKNGNPATKTDNFIHSDPSKGSTTALTIGLNQQDENGIFISTFYKQGQFLKNNIVYLNTNQTYELACAAEWTLTRIYEDSEAVYQKQNNASNMNIETDNLFGGQESVANMFTPSIENQQTASQSNVVNTVQPNIMSIDDMLA